MSELVGAVFWAVAVTLGLYLLINVLEDIRDALRDIRDTIRENLEE